MMPGVLVFSKSLDRAFARRPARRSRRRQGIGVLHARQARQLRGFGAAQGGKSGSEVVDTVNRKSFADVLTPLYPKLLPDPALRAMIKQVQADAETASVP